MKTQKGNGRKPELVSVSVSEIQGAICAWKGCEKSAPMFKELPPGWRYIVMSKGILLDPENLMRAERDSVLCPKHFDELSGFLKEI